MTAATLKSIAIAPAPATTGIANTVQLTALGSYSDGTTHDVTASAAWSSAMPSIATIGATTGKATLLPNGTVLAAGGIYVTLTYTSSAEIYDSVARTWTATGSLATARGGHTATLLASGALLVAGGLGNDAESTGSDSLLASSEIYY